MGVGFAVVTAPDDVDDVLAALRDAGETAWPIGRVTDTGTFEWEA